MRPVAALFFDLDRTLLDDSQYPESVVNTCKVISDRYLHLNFIDLQQAHRAMWLDYGAPSIDKWIAGSLSGHSLYREMWRRTLAICNIDDDATIDCATQAHLGFSRDSYQLFDDVRSSISALQKLNIPFALITNGAVDTQNEKIRAVEIEQWFDVISISGSTGGAKPNVSAFLPALTKLGVSGKNVWHIGDNLVTDVAGANAANITSVWINRNGAVQTADDPAPDIEVHSLTDLVHLLESEKERGAW